MASGVEGLQRGRLPVPVPPSSRRSARPHGRGEPHGSSELRSPHRKRSDARRLCREATAGDRDVLDPVVVPPARGRSQMPPPPPPPPPPHRSSQGAAFSGRRALVLGAVLTAGTALGLQFANQTVEELEPSRRGSDWDESISDEVRIDEGSRQGSLPAPASGDIARPKLREFNGRLYVRRPFSRDSTTAVLRVARSARRHSALVLEDARGDRFLLATTIPELDVRDREMMETVFSQPDWEKALVPIERPEREADPEGLSSSTSPPDLGTWLLRDW